MNNKLVDASIIDLIYKAHMKLTEIESVPREYVNNELLYSSEIHTICAIDKNPGINLTNLALELEVSKSAVSKFVTKLIKKEYIEKKRAIGNLKEVVFNLTSKGSAAVIKHREFKKNIFGPLIAKENELSNNKRAEYVSFLNELYNLM